LDGGIGGFELKLFGRNLFDIKFHLVVIFGILGGVQTFLIEDLLIDVFDFTIKSLKPKLYLNSYLSQCNYFCSVLLLLVAKFI